jgi:hypothetical protein
MSDIFRKTPLGYEEIVNRVNALSPRLRRCLILIDGKRSLVELMGLLQGEDMSPLIQTLEIEGYIELIGTARSYKGMANGTLSQSSTDLYSITNVNARHKTGSYIDPAIGFIDRNGRVRKPLGFEERKVRASRALNELLGPSAESITLRIEASRSEEALGLTLKIAANFLADAVNPMAAKRFRDHVRLLDPDQTFSTLTVV